MEPRLLAAGFPTLKASVPFHPSEPRLLAAGFKFMNNRQTIDIVITTNSPGELYSLVRPAVKAISAQMPEARIILVITPCQYASGREIEVARSFKEIYEVIFPQEFKAWALKNRPPKGITFAKKGMVLFMGGDLFHAVTLSRKLGYKACAYTMNRTGWNGSFSAFFVPDARMAEKAKQRKVPPDKIRIVGDLMAEGKRPEHDGIYFGLAADRPVLTFLPGSRSAHTKFLAPFFLRVADIMASKSPEIQFVFGLSPYSSTVKLEEFISPKKMDKAAKRYGASGRIVAEQKRKIIVTDSGTRILIIEKMPYDAMDIADLIVTVPGTNTAEAAALGKPMLAIVPFNKPEALLLDGITGIIGNAPFIGRFIKLFAARMLDRYVNFMALPNRKAGRQIIPELRGVLTAEQVAEKALEMIKDRSMLATIGRELKDISGSPEASNNIATEIKKLLSD